MAGKPEIPIDVDPATGVWTTNGMPMIYLPRHFYLNHLDAFEQALGPDRYKAVLDEAGAKSAREWCEAESSTHGLHGLDVFRHYMARISQRGWGQFSIVSIDGETGEGAVRLDNSVFVLQQKGKPAQKPLCNAFASWLKGSLEWAGGDLSRPWNLTATETRCAAVEGHGHCCFEVSASRHPEAP